jgi:hypothetical protein
MKKVGRPSILNITQKKEVVKYYIENQMTPNKICKIFSVSEETIRNILISEKVPRRTCADSKKLRMKFTFTKMNKDKAFLLGLIYGDGSISNRQCYINITSGDLDLLEKAQNTFKKYEGEFKIEQVKGKKYYRGHTYTKKLCVELFDLFKLTNNKSDKLIWPKLDDKLLPYFISGYLATDGCITIAKKDNLLQLIFYSCSEGHLQSLNEYLCYKTNLPLRKIYKRTKIKGHFGKKPLFTLNFNGIKAEKACEFIFANTTSETRSDRKFLIYKEFMKSKYNIII